MREIIIRWASPIPIIAYILQAQGIKTCRNEDESHKKVAPLPKKKSSINCARPACNDISNNFYASMTNFKADDMDNKTSKGPIVSYTDRNRKNFILFTHFHLLG
jgi:hypothetical protein